MGALEYLGAREIDDLIRQLERLLELRGRRVVVFGVHVQPPLT